MLQAYSQTEKALRDTSLRYSDGEAFDRLAQMYGWPRPPGISVKAWRSALRVALWGSRGTFQTLYAFLAEALSDYNIKATNCFQYNSDEFANLHELPNDTIATNPLKTLYRAYRVSVPIGSIAEGRIVGRHLTATLPDKTKLKTMVVHEAYKPGSGLRFLYVPHNPTAYWNRPSDNPSGTFEMSILPFTLDEPNPDMARSYRAMRAAQAKVSEEDAGTWVAKDVDKFMNAHHTVILTLFNDLSDILTLKHTYWQHDGTELAEDIVSDTEKWQGKVWFPEFDGKPSSSRPSNQPKGGQVQEDETKLGDPNGNGPFPPYLIDGDNLVGSQSKLFHALTMLMPDGCHLIVKTDNQMYDYPTVGKNPNIQNPPVGGIPNSLQP